MILLSYFGYILPIRPLLRLAFAKKVQRILHKPGLLGGLDYWFLLSNFGMTMVNFPRVNRSLKRLGEHGPI